jgi:2-methylcitrate dehydratase
VPNASQTTQIARYALRDHKLPGETAELLKRHLLDALGSLVFSLGQPTPAKLSRQIRLLGEGGSCAVPGLGLLPFDRAAQWLTALIRYPDFMDNFLGKEATCHPSDNIGGLLAAGTMQDCGGADFLAAMAVSYQIECRLIEVFPVMKNGFDHTVLLAQSQTAGMGRLLGLTEDQLANALGIVGSSFLSLAVGRASYTPEWKGFASALSALGCANAVLLAAQGMTGPIALFEGPQGYEKALHMKLDYDWSRDGFGLIHRCILKRYNAEVHAQSAIEALLALRREHSIDPAAIERVHLSVFRTCYEIIGGGEYGDRTQVHSKEQADHSLPYVAAVALLDGDVYPAQLTPARILREDVQALLKRVKADTVLPAKAPDVVHEHLDPLTRQYPDAMPVTAKITLRDGTKFECRQHDFPGFFTRPQSWEEVEAKFARLTHGLLDAPDAARVVDVVRNLERHRAPALMDAVARAHPDRTLRT